MKFGFKIGAEILLAILSGCVSTVAAWATTKVCDAVDKKIALKQKNEKEKIVNEE